MMSCQAFSLLSTTTLQLFCTTAGQSAMQNPVVCHPPTPFLTNPPTHPSIHPSIHPRNPLPPPAHTWRRWKANTHPPIHSKLGPTAQPTPSLLPSAPTPLTHPPSHTPPPPSPQTHLAQVEGLCVPRAPRADAAPPPRRLPNAQGSQRGLLGRLQALAARAAVLIQALGHPAGVWCVAPGVSGVCVAPGVSVGADTQLQSRTC